MTATIDFSVPIVRLDTADRVRNQLVGQGFKEIITNPMHDQEKSSVLGKKPVRVLNPLSKDMAVMRSSLLPGMLQVVATNQNYGSKDLRLFEIGHVFWEDPHAVGRIVDDFVEVERVGMVLSGNGRLPHWSESERPVDFFDLTGTVATLLESLGLDKIRFISYPTSIGLTEHSLAVEIQGLHSGTLGRVAADVLLRYGIEGDVFAVELDLGSLRKQTRAEYRPLPRLPGVRRDVAFIVEAGVEAGAIEAEIRRAGGELLVSVMVFDVYGGNGLPEGKKSLAFALSLMSEQRTLTDREIDAAVAGVVKHIERTFSAVLRST